MLKELVEHIVKTLVDKPELVSVSVTQEGLKHVIKIKVGELDLGRIIGKDGQTIRAIRALASAVIPAGEEVSVDVSK
ncbi:MAG TPA: KH domain-containing protein [Candidatus Babeliales bacterium]|nr:KH domain-containing protein [Candidatus Babeliales bacterium]